MTEIKSIQDNISAAQTLPGIMDELHAQKNVALVFWCLAIGVLFITGYAANTTGLAIFGALFVAEIFAAVIIWTRIRTGFMQRIEKITFTQQIDNLYVYSMNEHDETVAATFQTALEKLKAYGNKHQVRVYRFIFQQPNYVVMWHDAAGNLQKDVRWREEGTSYETFAQFNDWAMHTILAETDKRRRALAKDQTGSEWVDQHLFKQAFTPTSKKQ